jgi:hypothetical protein
VVEIEADQANQRLRKLLIAPKDAPSRLIVIVIVGRNLGTWVHLVISKYGLQDDRNEGGEPEKKGEVCGLRKIVFAVAVLHTSLQLASMESWWG